MGKTFFAFALFVAALAPGSGAIAGELESFKDCTLVETDWADGDSFLVRFPDGKENTVRLYGVDCIEREPNHESDARRQRAQRRYFGISTYGEGGGSLSSRDLASKIGELASTMVRELLQQPFTVTTAFADARGDGSYQRIYGFVELADGSDLAAVLVESGLARAFGVCRSRPGVQSADEYRERLKDLELRAAKLDLGAWKFTDWESLPEERKEERDEAAELRIRTGGKPDPAPNSIDPNQSARDTLMRLPGIGEAMANRIIEGREHGIYRSADDLDRVYGIGGKTIEKIRGFLTFPEQ